MAQPAEYHTLHTSYPAWHMWLASRRALLTIAVLGVLYGIIVSLPTPAGLA